MALKEHHVWGVSCTLSHSGLKYPSGKYRILHMHFSGQILYSQAPWTVHVIFKTHMCRWINLCTGRGVCGISLSARFVKSIFFFPPFWCLLDQQMMVQVKGELFCEENFVSPLFPKYINKKCAESKVLGPLLGHRKPVAGRRPPVSGLLCFIALLYLSPPLFFLVSLISFSRFF